jgi:phage terminase large subunit
MSNSALAEKLKEMQAHRHLTTCDSSEPKSIDSLKAKGCKVRGAMKGPDSINAGVDFLLEFEIVVNSHLVEFKTEFDNYCWSTDKEGKKKNKPVDDFNHFIDSLRYACEHRYIKKKRKPFKIHG